MENKFRLEFEDGTTKTVKAEIRLPKDVVQFVAGTTDPVNINGSKHGANKSYWIGKDNLWKHVKDLKPQFLDLHIQESFFSWSGDNNTDERTKAAERLLDSLLRTYSNWKKKEVHFHLIGHSHGGNVINQFTDIIAKNDDFPNNWKIKSITYLSTPFFGEKHQMNHGKIHPDCEIINVYNEYDITQRFVADFSLYNLENILATVDSHKFNKALDKIKLIIDSHTYSQIFEVFSYINKTEGALIWGRTVQLLDNVLIILDEVLACIASLKSSLAAEKAVLTEIVMQIRTSVDTIRTTFEGNVQNRDGNYGAAEFIKDLGPSNLITTVLNLVNRLLAITGGVKGSFLLNTLTNIFAENTGLTDSIDDTSWDPKRQVAGNYPIKYVNITTKDKYHSRGKKAKYEGFATGVEKSLKDENLQEMLMRLFSQFLDADGMQNTTKWINRVEYFVTGGLDAQLKTLRANIGGYRTLVAQFNADLIAEEDIVIEEEVEEAEIDSDVAFTAASILAFNNAYQAIEDRKEVEKEEKVDEEEEPAPHHLVPGSIPYLAVASHGLSHTKLWDDVESVLKSAFSSGENPGYSE